MTNEKRLIGEFRNELMREFIEQCQGNDFNRLSLLEIGETVDSIYEKYSTLPTVDAVGVVPGRWIEKEDMVASCLEGCTEVFYECSVCRAPNYGETDFYPNCGAKMDGGANP